MQIFDFFKIVYDKVFILQLLSGFLFHRLDFLRLEKGAEKYSHRDRLHMRNVFGLGRCLTGCFLRYRSFGGPLREFTSK